MSVNRRVAIVSKEDFERMKRRSAHVRTEPDPSIKEIRKAAAPSSLLERKSFPKSILREPSEDDRLILSRAEAAKQEELVEVRQANRILLAAKCHVIRNAQLSEKNEIKRELQEEDSRYHKIMEEEREKEFALAAKKELEKQKLKKEHAGFIKIQLENRAIDRQKQAENVQLEAEFLSFVRAKMEASDKEMVRQKEIRREKLKRDLQSSYELNKAVKNAEFEKERIAEMKIQEYIRLQKQREEQLEAQKRAKNEEREREFLKKCQAQQQSSKSQEEKYEKWVRREMEAKEREFRLKEYESAKRRKEFEAKILLDRQMQQDEKKRLREQERLRERKEYEENLRIWKEGLEKERQSDCSKEKQREYRQLIKDQIKCKEDQKRFTRQNLQKELEDSRRKELQRQERIDQILADKLKELKMSRVPDNLIKDVERRFKRAA